MHALWRVRSSPVCGIQHDNARQHHAMSGDIGSAVAISWDQVPDRGVRGDR